MRKHHALSIALFGSSVAVTTSALADPLIFRRLDEAANYLIESLAGYQLEQAFDYIGSMNTTINRTAIGRADLAPGTLQIVDRGRTYDVTSMRTEIACAFGGTRTVESAVLNLSDGDYTNDTGVNITVYDQCRLTADSDDLLDGDHVINGRTRELIGRVSTPDLERRTNVVRYKNLTLQAPEDNSLEITAQVRTSTTEATNQRSRRAVNVEQYVEVRDGSLLRSIRNADFRLTRRIREDGAVEHFDAVLNGSVLGTVTTGQGVVTSTLATLRSQRDEDNGTTLEGWLQLSSTNGSELTITASPTQPQDSSDLLYDYTLLTETGETITGANQPFPALPVDAPKKDQFFVGF